MFDREIWNRRRDCACPGDEAGLSFPLEVEDTNLPGASFPLEGVVVDEGLAGPGVGEESKALFSFSSFSFRTVAKRRSSRISAPGDVALTNGTVAPAPAARLVTLLLVGKTVLLTDRGVSSFLCAAAKEDGLGDPSSRPWLLIWTLWKTKSVNRRLV